MAAPSFNISGFLTVIDECDTGTGWSITDVDLDIKVEGVGAGYDAIRNGTTITYTFGSSQDMSGTDMHLRQWLMHTFFSYLNTKSAGGIQLFIGDASNTAYWYVGGSDTHNGAWQLFQADLSATPDSGTLPTLTAVTKFGFRLVHATAARNVVNTYWDIATFAKGYEIYGGTSGDKVTWLTLASADTGSTADKQYGVVSLIYGGALYLNSGLFLGDSAGTNDLYFDGTNQVIVFYDLDEKNGLYKLVGTGNSTGTTNIDLSGSVIKSSSTQFLFDMSGTNVSALTLDGTTIDNASSVLLKTGQTGSVVKVANSGKIKPNGATLSALTITDTTEATTGAMELVAATDLSNLSNVTFNNFTGKYALYIPASITGTLTLNNFQSDGSGTDVYWAGTGGTLTINKANGTNFSTSATAGGTVSIVSSSSISIHVQDENKVAIATAYVYINDDDSGAAEVNTTTDASGDVSTSYAGSVGTSTLRVRKYGYKPFVDTVDISSDLTRTITLITDPQQT